MSEGMLQIEFHVGTTFEPTATVVLRWCPKLKCYVHYESCRYCPHAEITCSFEKYEHDAMKQQEGGEIGED